VKVTEQVDFLVDISFVGLQNQKNIKIEEEKADTVESEGGEGGKEEEVESAVRRVRWV